MNKTPWISVIAVWLLGCSSSAATTVPAVDQASNAVAGITFDVEGIKSSEGVIRCGLFSSENQWLKEIHAGAIGDIEDGRASCLFDPLPPGEYAISAYHDANANEKFDTNAIGWALEGYCASNDAKPIFGPPRYNQARFQYDGGAMHLNAKMIYHPVVRRKQ
jgi:uncharacterized protein (DUF2141 family)